MMDTVMKEEAAESEGAGCVRVDGGGGGVGGAPWECWTD